MKKLFSVLAATLIVALFGIMQYLGMERAAALVYDVIGTFHDDMNDRLPGEEFLNNATMSVNGQTVNLSYSLSYETAPTVLNEIAARLPHDSAGKVVYIRDKGGIVAYRDQKLMSLISASWDPPSGASIITRAWSELSAQAENVVPENVAEFAGELLSENEGALESLQQMAQAGSDFPQFMNYSQALLFNNPRLAPVMNLLRGVAHAQSGRDQPGFDLDEVPRMPNSVRSLSMTQNSPSGSKMAMLTYFDSVEFPVADNFHYSSMKSAGWQTSQLFEEQENASFGHKKYLFTKDRKNCLLVLDEPNGKPETKVTILYLDRIL